MKDNLKKEFLLTILILNKDDYNLFNKSNRGQTTRGQFGQGFEHGSVLLFLRSCCA